MLNATRGECVIIVQKMSIDVTCYLLQNGRIEFSISVCVVQAVSW